MKSSVWVAVSLLAGLVFFSGCQEIDGECWPVSEDGEGAGAGGPIVPSGAGGFGDVPEP